MPQARTYSSCIGMTQMEDPAGPLPAATHAGAALAVPDKALYVSCAQFFLGRWPRGAYNRTMTPSWLSLRVVAVILVAVLVLTLAAPARAEAEVLTTIAIVSLIIAGVIIIVYLIVANLHDRWADAGPVLLACVDSDAVPRTCWPVSELPAVVMPVPVMQSP